MTQGHYAHIVFAAVVLLAGCQHDNELNKRTDVQGAHDWPKIEVTPPSLDFGELGYGESAEQVVTITNVGTDMSLLEVDDIELAIGGDRGYAITGLDVIEGETDELPVTLRFSESIEAVVSFTTMEPVEETGQIIVHSSDEENPAVPVPLAGLGLMPRLVVVPNPLEYDVTTVGCSREQDITLTNVGTQGLEVTEIMSDSERGEFNVLTRPPFPLTIAPGASEVIHMGFAPVVGGEASGMIVVESNDPRGTQRAAQLGVGSEPGTYLDAVTVPTAGKIDIIFVVDQSVSMDDNQATLAQQAGALGTALAAVTDDWRLIVVNGDDGCNIGGIMSATTPDFAAAFTAAVQYGEEGTYSEALIYLADRAVDQSDVRECNESFPRPDALLHVIAVTDEAYDVEALVDESWEVLIDRMRRHQNADYLVKFSAVANLDYDGAYEDAVRATDGAELDIRATTWGGEIDTVAASVITQSTFPLAEWPDMSTLRVYVNGVLRLTGWQYREDIRAVRFYEDLPRSGDLVELSYTVPYTCE